MAVNQNIFNVILVYGKEKVFNLLFSLYLNDLQTFLATENIKGIESVTEALEKDINVYLKLFVLLYADDTVLLAETADDYIVLNYIVKHGNLKLMQPRQKCRFFQEAILTFSIYV